MTPSTLGIYLHLPFCRSRCSYCAFYTVPQDHDRAVAFVNALEREIGTVAREGRNASPRAIPPQAGRRVDTIYLGGGTPSLLPPRDLDRLLDAVRRSFAVDPDAEITIEANPETVTRSAALAWAAGGFNRVSVGAQSFAAEVLGALGRQHGPAETVAAVHALREAGFDNVNLDLIAGVHPSGLAEDLAAALALGPEHLSLYLLEATEEETGRPTGLTRRRAVGSNPLPDEDWFADTYPRSVGFLEDAGLRRYEICNFSSPGRESRHNLKYWRCEEVLGFGPASHSLVAGVRHSVEADLDAYLRGSAAGAPRIQVDDAEPGQRLAEVLFLGLRLSAGLNEDMVRARGGTGIPPAILTGLERLRGAGLVTKREGRWSLTDRGVLLSNEVFQTFLP
jgi:oxygen-independent coproporphyrinogen-3 oxidase